VSGKLGNGFFFDHPSIKNALIRIVDMTASVCVLAFVSIPTIALIDREQGTLGHWLLDFAKGQSFLGSVPLIVRISVLVVPFVFSVIWVDRRKTHILPWFRKHKWFNGPKVR
jgi:hypothetical protein